MFFHHLLRRGLTVSAVNIVNRTDNWSVAGSGNSAIDPVGPEEDEADYSQAQSMHIERKFSEERNRVPGRHMYLCCAIALELLWF
jgi:hypothetical protein